MAEDDIPLSDPSPRLIPLFPDEISILCIARVHVTSHTAIAQVLRSWRSFVRSPSFFSLRSELAVTKLVLTVCIKNYSGGGNRWYHLHPYQTPFPLPLTEEHEHDGGFACASLGSHLFIIGGFSSQNSLRIYDRCLRRWSHGPPTSMPRTFATAGVAGSRILVLDGENSLSGPMSESLDPAGTRWDPVPPIPAHISLNWCYVRHVMDGKVLIRLEGYEGELFGAAFDPDTAEWANAPPWWMEPCLMDNLPLGRLAVVGGVPYVLQNHISGYGNDGQWWPVEGESVTELLYRMDPESLLTFGGYCVWWGEKGN